MPADHKGKLIESLEVVCICRRMLVKRANDVKKPLKRVGLNAVLGGRVPRIAFAALSR